MAARASQIVSSMDGSSPDDSELWRGSSVRRDGGLPIIDVVTARCAIGPKGSEVVAAFVMSTGASVNVGIAPWIKWHLPQIGTAQVGRTGRCGDQDVEPLARSGKAP